MRTDDSIHERGSRTVIWSFAIMAGITLYAYGHTRLFINTILIMAVVLFWRQGPTDLWLRCAKSDVAARFLVRFYPAWALHLDGVLFRTRGRPPSSLPFICSRITIFLFSRPSTVQPYPKMLRPLRQTMSRSDPAWTRNRRRSSRTRSNRLKAPLLLLVHLLKGHVHSRAICRS